MNEHKCNECIWAHIVDYVVGPFKESFTLNVCRAITPNIVMDGIVVSCTSFQTEEEFYEEN